MNKLLLATALLTALSAPL